MNTGINLYSLKKTIFAQNNANARHYEKQL